MRSPGPASARALLAILLLFSVGNILGTVLFFVLRGAASGVRR